MRTRQVVFTGPGAMEVLEAELPEPRAGEVLVRHELTLVSPGTERARLLALPGAKPFPYRAGYSGVGVVVAAGPGVAEPPVGTRVIDPGLHADFALVPASATFPLPPGLDPEAAAFARLAAIALQGVRKARLEIGESVLVIGLGLVGLLAAQLAQVGGGMPVVAAERDPFRREVASRCGIAFTVGTDPGGAPAPQELRALADEAGGVAAGFDVVIDATGQPEVPAVAVEAAAPRGRVVLLGSTRGASTVDLYGTVHKRGLQLIGAHNEVRPRADDAPSYWTEQRDTGVVLRLLACGRLRVAPCVTDRVAPDGLPALYARLAAWDPRLLAAVIRWSGGG